MRVIPDNHDRERLSVVLDGADEAFVAMDDSGTVTEWNRAAQELLGFSREQAAGRPLAELIIPPALREAHARGLRRFLATGTSRVVGHRLELPALHADGHEVPVELRIFAVPSPQGWSLHAFMHDVTARREAAQQAELLASIVRDSGDAIFGVDDDGVIVSWNAAAEHLFGYHAKDVLGRDMALLMLPGHEGELAEITRTLVEDERSFRAEVRRRHRDGHAVDVALTVSPLHDADGTVIGRSAIARDITERRSSEERLISYTGELKARMSEDPRTGLRAGHELHLAMDRRIRAGVTFTLLVLDLDERCGTDGTLRSLAAAAEASLRDSDEAFSHGAATLALLLTASSPADAAAAEGRVRAALADAVPGCSYTAGTAAWPATAWDPDELVRAARRAVEDQRAADGSAGRERRAGLPPAAVAAVERLLSAATSHLSMDVAWLSEFVDGEQIFRGLAGDGDSFGLEREASAPLDASYCVRVLDGRLPAAIPDTAENAITRELRGTYEARIGAYLGVPVQLDDGGVYGMLCAASHDPRPDLQESDAKALALLAVLVAERLQEERTAAEAHRVDVEDTGIVALLAALDARDHYTGDHSQAVVELAGAVARELGLPAGIVGEVEQVALLHDVGKVGIPDTVLQKRGPLNELEWDLMRQHSALGGRIVASIDSLAHLAPAVRAEHERWDGGGYPDGLQGADIPMASRVVLASDAYHAMTSDRPYRRALEHHVVVEELRACAGSQFDPDVVGALIRVVDAG